MNCHHCHNWVGASLTRFLLHSSIELYAMYRLCEVMHISSLIAMQSYAKLCKAMQEPIEGLQLHFSVCVLSVMCSICGLMDSRCDT